MSSSNSDDFFGDGESESEGNENGKDELGSAASEGSQESSPEEASPKNNGARQPKMSDSDRNGDVSNEGDDDDVNSESIQEVVEEEEDEGSSDRLGGDEAVTHSDRSDELEKLFDASLSGTTPSPASPNAPTHSSLRPASAKCRVKVVVDQPPGQKSQKGKHIAIGRLVHGNIERSNYTER